MQFINEFKSCVFSSRSQLQSRRMSISQDELDAYWESRTLTEMSHIFTITNQYILNFMVSYLLQQYLGRRKFNYQAFIVSKIDQKSQQQSLMYVYDCKLFRCAHYSKEENDFLSSFIVCYKEDIPNNQPIYEIIDFNLLAPNQWILKVKESALLRTYSLIKETVAKLPHSTDKIVLDEGNYHDFMQNWLKIYLSTYSIELTTQYLFKALLALLQNQILLYYCASLTEQQKYERMYLRPIRYIQKPKNVEQFTLTQNHFGQIKWQSLKITAFKLKYNIKQEEGGYHCYRSEQQYDQICHYQNLNQEDSRIFAAFQKIRKIEEEYQNQF